MVASTSVRTRNDAGVSVGGVGTGLNLHADPADVGGWHRREVEGPLGGAGAAGRVATPMAVQGWGWEAGLANLKPTLVGPPALAAT